jgi:sulfonate transport system permease protein
MFWHVILKTALSYVIAGMKTSVSLCFAALVVAEMIGSDTGLGFIIVDGRNWFKVANMFMAMASIAVLQTIFQAIFEIVEKKLFKWKNEGIASAIE